MQGKYIVIEGLEGAGKSTQIQQLEASLSVHLAQRPLCVREPGGTVLAEKIRSLVKSCNEERITTETEMLLMFAARSQLVEHRIRPALDLGQWVLGDRHVLSTRAYQGGGRGLDDDRIMALKSWVLGDFTPDMTIYLDIDPALGMARARGRGALDRFEQEGLSFLERTRARYLEIARSDPRVFIVDAARSADIVASDVLTQVRAVLPVCVGQDS
jgi:dTMP kinase